MDAKGHVENDTPDYVIDPPGPTPYLIFVVLSALVAVYSWSVELGSLPRASAFWFVGGRFVSPICSAYLLWLLKPPRWELKVYGSHLLARSKVFHLPEKLNYADIVSVGGSHGGTSGKGRERIVRIRMKSRKIYVIAGNRNVSVEEVVTDLRRRYRSHR